MQPASSRLPLPIPTPPLRVAVDLSILRPGGENGGIKPFLFETLLWLGRQQQVSLKFFYLTCARTHGEVRDELARTGDELICVRDDGGPLPSGNERVPRERQCIPPPPDLLWQIDAQVLYCPFGPVDFALPGVGTISTIVDVLHRDFPWSLEPQHNANRERVFQEILAVADRLQCISHHVVSRMHTHYNVPAERMFTVYIAVHQRFAAMAPLASQLSAKEDELGTALFFFYPANAWKHKNHETLLLAYGMYRAEARKAGQKPWPLLLTGYEDERWEEMRSLAGVLGLLGDEAVQFRGYVPPHEFGRLWETAGALVFPSLHEGFGIPLLEAMQHDLPVLTSREGSLPEIGADACLYADARRPEALADGMTRLANDPELRRRLVAAGRRRLQEFSLDQESGHLLAAISELATSPPIYRPYSKGIFPDGWTEPNAVLALPTGPAGRLTLRFNPMPAPRRLRLQTGAFVALGSFELPSDSVGLEVLIDFRPNGGALFLKVPNATNLNAADARVHGVRLLSVDLRLSDGREYLLFAAR